MWVGSSRSATLALNRLEVTLHLTLLELILDYVSFEVSVLLLPVTSESSSWASTPPADHLKTGLSSSVFRKSYESIAGVALSPFSSLTPCYFTFFLEFLISEKFISWPSSSGVYDLREATFHHRCHLLSRFLFLRIGTDFCQILLRLQRVPSSLRCSQSVSPWSTLLRFIWSLCSLNYLQENIIEMQGEKS